MKDEVRSGITLAISVIVILVVVYFATAIFMTGEIGNKNTKKTKTTTEAVSNTETFDNMIMASNALSQSGDSYYVIFFSKEKASNELKDSISKYSGDMKLYKVNLDEAINKSVKGDSNVLMVDNINDLKVKDSALITVTNNKVEGFVEKASEIIEKLK